jgi:hypothetical protein
MEVLQMRNLSYNMTDRVNYENRNNNNQTIKQ